MRPLCTLICALLCAVTASAAEKLADRGFDLSTPNGTFPDYGVWQPASAGIEAGAICTTTAARSGNGPATNGLWAFTGFISDQTWVAPFQQTAAYPGAVFRASAYVRTPPGEPWVAGSQARIRVEFLGPATNVLGAFETPAFNGPNTNWTLLEITTGAAPAGTTRARYVCLLAKPAASGVSVVNFDDCSLVDPAEYLLNGGFEEVFNAPPVGPMATNWVGAWLGEAGGVAIRPADQGDRVLWQFTGSLTNDWWSSMRQEVTAAPGVAFRASAWLRTPPGEPWIAGSRAYFKVSFLNTSNSILTSYESESLGAVETNWTRFEVLTKPAPPTTAGARLTCYLEKPQASNGLSVANFDDCSLVEVAVPGARVLTRSIGIEADTNQAAFGLQNLGKAPLTYQIIETLPWLSIPAASGVVPPLTNVSIAMHVSRAGIAGTETVQGSVTLQTSDGNIPLDVYVEMPAAGPPMLPAEVRFYGSQLRVRDRLPDGTLSEPYHYAIKGTCWSPSSMGASPGPFFRRQEFAKWQVADIQMLRAMNANTVYVFLDFGPGPGGLKVLDNLYRNGLKVIVTVDEDGTANSNVLAQIVTAYRQHPAILAWAIGNEWNINFYHRRFSNIVDAASATESMARQVKALDGSHPVVAIYGDIDIPGLNPLRKADETTNQPVSTERIVQDLCPSVDAWGLNIYRGASFGNVFAQWKSITAKPMFFSEYGTDAYRISVLDVLDGAEDEAMQAAFHHGLWQEIVTNLSALHLAGVCAGGTVFAWNDEWWKAREEHGASIHAQENLGFYGGHPDGFANEEWFAITAADRRRRASYFVFQSDYAAVTAEPDLDGDALPDAWEYGIVDAGGEDAIRSVVDVAAEGDFDGDGLSNRHEYLADTDPASSESRLRVTQLTTSNQTARIEWAGGRQSTQYLERGISPRGPWHAFLTNEPPTAVTNHFLDAIPAAVPERFYRIRAVR